MSVLVVWEPILATDWGPPSSSTLARISDRRVQQFWDPKHVVATALNAMAKRNPPKPEPACCVQKGFYWDEAILYSSGLHWRDERASLLWNGPLAAIIPQLEKAFGELD